MKIEYKAIEEAYEYVNMADPYMHDAILNKETGKIYFQSELSDLDEFPDDSEDDKYIEIPRKHDFNLGQPLVLEFVAEHMPSQLHEVRNIFRRKGAYSKYKYLLDRQNMLEKWYEYESDAIERALRKWCKENKIEIPG